jgi:hypothetical protein
MRRVDLQVYGLSVDALIAAGDPGSLALDLALDVAKVIEFAVRDVVKLSPLGAPSLIGVSVGDMDGIFRLLIRNIDKLKDQGPSRDDATTAG